MTVASAEGVTFDVEMPVVVIGGGAAGLVAALAARAEGAEVLVVERDPGSRGSTALSAGLIPAAGTRWQKDAQIEDNPSLFAQDILRKAQGEPDRAVVAALTQEAGPTLEWLADRHSMPFTLVDNFTYPGHSARRMHGLPTRSGLELVDRLREAAEGAGAELLYSAHVTTLFADGSGRVHGICYVRPDGSGERVRCGALILACNGFGGNKVLVRRHIPAMADSLYFGHDGNQGDAVLWGEALGAATADMTGHQGHGSVAHPHGILITWATMTEGGFQVNADGHRFSDESCGYSEQAALVAAQPGGSAWSIFDERIAQIARQFEDYRQAEAAGAVIGAETLDDLAIRMGVPAAALVDTAATVMKMKLSGTEDAFGRQFVGLPPLQPPFRAVHVVGALFHTQGGLAVDASGQVLNADGKLLPNLWAAGGAARGVSGSQASGYLSGNGLLSAIVLGRLSGSAAARTSL